MADLIPPEPLQNLLAGYVLGDLTPEETEVLQHHLQQQPELRVELQHLQEALAAMPYALPVVHPPAHVRDRLLRTIATVAPVDSSSGQPVVRGTEVRSIASAPSRRRDRQHWPFLLGSMAALTALALGLDNWRLRQDLVTAQAEASRQTALLRQDLAAAETQLASQKDLIAMLQQPTTQLVTLKSMDTKAPAKGNVVMTPGDRAVIVALQNLPPLQPGQYYYLWANEAGQKVACGKFTATETGEVFVKLVLPNTSNSKQLAITVENSPTMTAPQGPMVMISKS